MRSLAAIAALGTLGSVPAQSGWTLRTPAVAPTPRTWNLLTYDLTRGVTVLFGGITQTSTVMLLGDTWEWNGSTWAQRTPPNPPSPRCCFAHGFDLVRGRVVLFGGLNGAVNLNDTWEYDGTTWTQVPTLFGPPARRLAAMAFDVVRGHLVMFGGGDAAGGLPNTQADMWEWNGVVWTQLFPAHVPPARWSFGMATDFAQGRVLLHGGTSGWGGSPATLSDTWSWNGTDWTEIATAVAPPPVLSFGMTYAATHGAPVLFGGEPLSNETWLFAGNTWVRDPAPVAPPPQFGSTLAFDVSAGRVVFFGNSGTWEYGMPDLAKWLPFGTGCAGSAGVPRLQSVASARPVVGTTFPLELVQVPSSGLAAISIGFSTSTWSGGLLPGSLASLGMPGCTLWVDPAFLFTTPINLGRATLSWPLPNNAALAGVQFFDQAIVLDPGVNALGAVVSNAGAGVIGTL